MGEYFQIADEINAGSGERHLTYEETVFDDFEKGAGFALNWVM